MSGGCVCGAGCSHQQRNVAVDQVLREPRLDRANRIVVEIKRRVCALVLAVVGGEEALRGQAGCSHRGGVCVGGYCGEEGRTCLVQEQALSGGHGHGDARAGERLAELIEGHAAARDLDGGGCESEPAG